MIPEEEHFKNFLDRLENPKPPFHDSLPEVVDTVFPDSPTTREFEIFIMKSKIFHHGRLKGGKKANSGRQEYNSYQIIDLETLVSDAAFNIFFYYNVVRDSEKHTALITGLFERLLYYYDLMANTVLEIGSVKENTISDIKKVIEGWKRKSLITVNKTHSIKSLISKTCYENDLKIKLAILFINNIPEASPSRIAKCISILLSDPLINVIINIDTYRKEVMELKKMIITQK